MDNMFEPRGDEDKEIIVDDGSETSGVCPEPTDNDSEGSNRQ